MILKVQGLHICLLVLREWVHWLIVLFSLCLRDRFVIFQSTLIWKFLFIYFVFSQHESHKFCLCIGWLLQAQAEKIRSVQGMLQRFRTLFNLPSTIRGSISKGEYDLAVREYKKAKSIALPSHVCNNIFFPSSTKATNSIINLFANW